jgi:NAD(P)H-flavin reductase
VPRVRRDLPDTVTVEMQSADHAGRAFAPGQFNMLYAPGSGEIPISISGDPARPAILTHTVRAVGAVSAALCHMRQGAVLGVRGPTGQGWPV